MAFRYNINDPSTWGFFNLSPNSRPMGLGVLANPGIVFKRKFRWTLEIQFCLGTDGSIQTVPETYLKSASRPNIDIEETQIDYLNGRMWIPGKATPQTMTVSYYDVAGTAINTPTTCDDTSADPNISCYTCYDNLAGDTPIPGATGSTALFNWLITIYNFTDPCALQMGSRLGDYAGEALLRLYDGCGQAIEVWLMTNVFPTNINFGELDMSDSEVCMVELTLRWSSVNYRQLCPATTLNPCPCTSCS